MNNVQAVALMFVCAVLGFVFGAHEGTRYERTKQQAEIARIQAEKAQAVANAVDVYSEELDHLASSNADLTALVARLRRSKSATVSGACNVERTAVARCQDLLREGAELLREGSDLVGRNAAKHDAAVNARVHTK